MKKLLFLITTITLTSNVFANKLTKTDEEICIEKGGKVFTTDSIFGEYQHGLTQKFCDFEHTEGKSKYNVYIDIKTVASRRPTIAGSYIAKSIDINAMYKDGVVTKPPHISICKALNGTMVEFYTQNGGFIVPNGVTGMCMFKDGSMADIWGIIYRSSDVNYFYLKDKINPSSILGDDEGLPYLVK